MRKHVLAIFLVFILSTHNTLASRGFLQHSARDLHTLAEKTNTATKDQFVENLAQVTQLSGLQKNAQATGSQALITGAPTMTGGLSGAAAISSLVGGGGSGGNTGINTTSSTSTQASTENGVANVNSQSQSQTGGNQASATAQATAPNAQAATNAGSSATGSYANAYQSSSSGNNNNIGTITSSPGVIGQMNGVTTDSSLGISPQGGTGQVNIDS